MEHANAKKEPPWLPLPPMPRLSVSSSARARLSHRRPLLLSPSPASSSDTLLLSSTLPDLSPSLPLSVEGSSISVTCCSANFPKISTEASLFSVNCVAANLPKISTGGSSISVNWCEATSPKISTDLIHEPRTVYLSNDDSSENRSLQACSQLLHPNFPGTALADVSHSSADDSLPNGPTSSESPSLPVLHSSSAPQSLEDQRGTCEMSVRLSTVDSAVLNSDVPLSQDLPSFGTDDILCPTANVSEDVLTKSDDIVEQESSFIADPKVSNLSTNGELAVEDTELEEGQLPGEWSGAEESQETDGFIAVQTSEEHADAPLDLEWPPPEGIDRFCFTSESTEVYSEQARRGNQKAKKSNHKKGAGSKKRAREKSKEKYNEKKRSRQGKSIDASPRVISNGKDITEGGSCRGEFKVPRSVEVSKPVLDEGPEDGEILVESSKTNGILSSLVEGEVGLWTTDDVDDELFSQAEEDGVAKKKRGPETAERKLKRRIAKRKRRAQKEREMGIRRPPRTVQSKPVKVLCTHYMKGRCAKGDQCTFSHDAVPLTKQEPCKFLMSHSCLKGDDCPYSHDLGAFPCKFFHTRGLCYDGPKCQFSHGAISEEALEKLQKRVEKEKKDRINTPSALDVSAPTFSIPLPPELDPDPLGWGNQSSYHDHEGPFDTDFANLDRSGDHYGDSKNHPSGLALTGPSNMKDNEVVTLRMEEAVAKQQSLGCRDSSPLGSGITINSGKFEDEPEFPALSSLLVEKQGSNMSPLNRICSSSSIQPPNERSNARKILEVSMMDGMNAESCVQEPLSDGNSFESRFQSIFSPSSALVPQVPTITLTGTPIQLLRGRHLGDRKLEHDKVQQCPTLATAKRQHTVESLLDEALRH